MPPAIAATHGRRWRSGSDASVMIFLESADKPRMSRALIYTNNEEKRREAAVDEGRAGAARRARGGAGGRAVRPPAPRHDRARGENPRPGRVRARSPSTP